MYNTAVDHLKSLKDAELVVSNNRPAIFTASMQRSGQHAVLAWLCKNLAPVIHFNHCVFEVTNGKVVVAPLKGRCVIYTSSDVIDFGIGNVKEMLKKLNDYNLDDYVILYSFEDLNLDNKIYKKIKSKYLAKEILIIRDPLNWLASAIKHNKATERQLKKKIKIYNKYYDLCRSKKAEFIIYNDWLTGERSEIYKSLWLPYEYRGDFSDLDVQPFGGGSSFTGSQQSMNLVDNVQSRWLEMKDNDKFRRLVGGFDIDSSSFVKMFGFDPCASLEKIT